MSTVNRKSHHHDLSGLFVTSPCILERDVQAPCILGSVELSSEVFLQLQILYHTPVSLVSFLSVLLEAVHQACPSLAMAPALFLEGKFTILFSIQNELLMAINHAEVLVQTSAPCQMSIAYARSLPRPLHDG
jgi:hypothetical protein